MEWLAIYRSQRTVCRSSNEVLGFGSESFGTRAPLPGEYSLEVRRRLALRVSEKRTEEVATVKIPAAKWED